MSAWPSRSSRCLEALVTQLLLLYRYIFVLGDEARRMAQARRLRSFGRRGMGWRVYGQMLGQLLLRTFARAQRIYLAMKARGFDGNVRIARRLHFGAERPRLHAGLVRRLHRLPGRQRRRWPSATSSPARPDEPEGRLSHHTISVRDLSFAYPDGTQALDGVSFEVGHGEAIAVVGANGAGKSTLLLHLNGLLTPEHGSVDIGGIPVTKGTLADIRRTVGTVFQDPDDQLFMPTVAEDVGFGPLNLGLSPEDVAARVIAALARVGAEHLAERPPYHLSGGEKRAVAIATVLAMEPSVLVMDEPSSGLDPRARRRLIGLLEGFEHTRIIATHDLDLAAQLCERTIVMGGGRVLADQPTADVFRDDALLEAGGLERPLGMLACPICGGSGARPGAD